VRFVLTPLSSLKDSELPRLFKNFRDLEDIFKKRIGPDNIVDGSLTGALVAPDTLSPSNIVNRPQAASGTFTGDATVSRIIPLGFIPRYVEVWKQSNGMTFHAIGSGTAAFSNFMRDAAGVQTSAAADWQGIDTTGSGGFKLGSGAGGGLSNTNAVVFWWVAYR
jgi:hypothetical protein